MNIRTIGVLLLVVSGLVAGLPAQSKTFPVSELKPGMVATGRTVFQGDQLEEFKAHILGVLHNSIGPRRDLILARLEGGPLANTGVIAGMSGSPVYIDGRLVGAVSYSLGEFAKEPLAGITPIEEMIADATLPDGQRRAQVPRAQLTLPVTQEGLRDSLRQAFSWARPFAESPADVSVIGTNTVNAGIATLLRPISTPISFSGFDTRTIDPLVSAFRDLGFMPVLAGAAQLGSQSSTASAPSGSSSAPLRPGDPIGVALMNGDLQVGATGTVTEVDGNRVYAFGHPFYGLGPTQFPMTRAHVITVLPSLSSSIKIASTGDVIGIVQQDRATTIAGTLGPGPSMIPISLTLNSERGTRKKFSIGIVNDQLFTPLLAYVAILNTLTSYERQNGVGTYTLKGAARVKNHSDVAFEDLFTGDQPSTYAAASVVAPLNVLLRNAFEDVQFEGLNLEIEASETPRSATLERVWIDGTKAKPGAPVDLRILLRTYRGEEVTQSLPVQIPANARGSVSIMVADARNLSQFEARELQVQPLQTTGLPQMIRVLNSSRKNNRLYVRLVTRDGGAVVKGEPLAALPSSVLAVMESDRNGGSFRPLQSALVGEWEITAGYAVTGSKTLTLPLEE
ncbi:MAG TPA: SpoIVB peptidase S55 domain-containing protein [Vicinamibacterales bacterium]|nr:SpoIVB peptidase S55 domain-containing protein [Vicinamibacterales bacterium]